MQNHDGAHVDVPRGPGVVELGDGTWSFVGDVTERKALCGSREDLERGSERERGERGREIER